MDVTGQLSADRSVSYVTDVMGRLCQSSVSHSCGELGPELLHPEGEKTGGKSFILFWGGDVILIVSEDESSGDQTLGDETDFCIKTKSLTVWVDILSGLQ